jgi:fumarate hydratase subunit beta
MEVRPMEHRITLPLTREKAAAVGAGDRVLLSGTLYTARDAAHKAIAALAEAGKPLPFSLRDAVIYYAGPAPAAPGQVIGSAGPTSSYRMDAYTPLLLRLGLRGMIGKGLRSAQVVEAMREAGAVYFAATGGAGALLSLCVRAARVIAFPELGTEAVRRLEVEAFPVTAVIDSRGRDLYKLGRERYLHQLAISSEQ